MPDPTPTAADALRVLTEALTKPDPPEPYCSILNLFRRQCQGNPDTERTCFAQFHVHRIEAALALAARVRTGWRQLAEEQPEDGQLCLTWPGRLGQVTVEAWKSGILSGFRRENVTHWLPLPPPPEAAP